MWGRKQRTIDVLRRRVNDLEERLCPCGAHDWMDMGEREYFCAGVAIDCMIWYKCRRCGKIKLDWR